MEGNIINLKTGIGGDGGQVNTGQSGINITVDATDSINSVINFTGTYFIPSTLFSDYGFIDNSANWDTAFTLVSKIRLN